MGYLTTLPEFLEFVVSLRTELRMGKSVSMALESVIGRLSSPFSRNMNVWLIRTQAGHDREALRKVLVPLYKNATRRSFLAILERGFKGTPIDGPLADLEAECFLQLEFSYERRLQLLPLKLLVPLLTMIFPGIMLLILSPLFYSLEKGF